MSLRFNCYLTIKDLTKRYYFVIVFQTPKIEFPLPITQYSREGVRTFSVYRYVLSTFFIRLIKYERFLNDETASESEPKKVWVCMTTETEMGKMVNRHCFVFLLTSKEICN